MLNAYQRKLTLLDGMIFVAATGVALGWERVYLTFVATRLAAMSRYMVMKYYLYGIVPFLVMYALILLILSLKPFPSPIRSVARRPGTIACFAIMLGVIAAGLSILVELSFSAFVYRTLTGGETSCIIAGGNRTVLPSLADWAMPPTNSKNWVARTIV